MELMPWRPFGGELSSFRREMDNLWNRFFGGMLAYAITWTASGPKLSVKIRDLKNQQPRYLLLTLLVVFFQYHENILKDL